jgi:hypothetical protein
MLSPRPEAISASFFYCLFWRRKIFEMVEAAGVEFNREEK